MSVSSASSRPFIPGVSGSSTAQPIAPSSAAKPAPSGRGAEVDSFEKGRKSGPVSLDGGAPPGGTQGLAEAEKAAPVTPIDGIDPKVLETQEKLSKARQALGAWEVNGSQDESTQVTLENEVATLEAEEKTQFEDPNLKDDVEKAQFVVLEKRMGELEQKYGKNQAITLARQTYYNSDLWNLAGGSHKASNAQVKALGLPHTPGEKNNRVEVGGFEGQFRAPDGQPVDMGHVLCGMDWQVNKDRVPKDLNINELAKASGQEGAAKALKLLPGSNGVTVPNPFDKDFVTLTGDLGSAVENRYKGKSAEEAVAGEGDYDWNGDLDGLNVAHRMETNPNLSASDALKSYYDSGESKNRLNEVATHSKYFQRDGAGVPRWDDKGHYKMDLDKMASDGFVAALLLGHDKDTLSGGALDKVNPFQDKAKDVAKAYEKWVHAAQDRA
ncbi:hypothetical protein [Corallococcus llansteffanensis]|uniref:Uncharacterized protein n=1 Tax=Corallococcus llansteffanensis TaxID=2316731 RepID=A0A3A8Q608_9BACT|nr:hypothetical protein [Corallococcus llansteffanensis]RKH62931.1 hypothetical protein D7V93_09310 [Corallococcus llansteffanensis]